MGRLGLAPLVLSLPDPVLGPPDGAVAPVTVPPRAALGESMPEWASASTDTFAGLRSWRAGGDKAAVPRCVDPLDVLRPFWLGDPLDRVKGTGEQRISREGISASLKTRRYSSDSRVGAISRATMAFQSRVRAVGGANTALFRAGGAARPAQYPPRPHVKTGDPPSSRRSLVVRADAGTAVDIDASVEEDIQFFDSPSLLDADQSSASARLGLTFADDGSATIRVSVAPSG